MIDEEYRSAYQKGYSDAMHDFRKEPKSDVLDKKGNRGMVEILNDLQSFCKECPYARLVYKERLASGLTVYTCEFLRRCTRVYNDSMRMKEMVESEDTE